jgi:hypothetical protein
MHTSLAGRKCKPCFKLHREIYFRELIKTIADGLQQVFLYADISCVFSCLKAKYFVENPFILVRLFSSCNRLLRVGDKDCNPLLPNMLMHSRFSVDFRLAVEEHSLIAFPYIKLL